MRAVNTAATAEVRSTPRLLSKTSAKVFLLCKCNLHLKRVRWSEGWEKDRNRKDEYEKKESIKKRKRIPAAVCGTALSARLQM